MATSFQSQLLNFRKMKHEFSPQILRDGKILYDKHAVVSSTIAQFTDNSVKISSQVQGNFGNNYCCEIEIDRHESEILDSNCDCPHHSDCMHLACLLIHLENHFEALVVQHFDGKNKKKIANAQDPKSAQLKKVLQHAEKKGRRIAICTSICLKGKGPIGTKRSESSPCSLLNSSSGTKKADLPRSSAERQ